MLQNYLLIVKHCDASRGQCWIEYFVVPRKESIEEARRTVFNLQDVEQNEIQEELLLPLRDSFH